MTSIPPVLLRYMQALAGHDVAAVAETVADRLAFVSVGQTLDKPRFLAFLTALYAAFPDWHYEHDPPEIGAGGVVCIRWRQGGTHTGMLALPGLPVVAATGTHVRVGPQDFHYRVDGGSIVEIHPDPTPGGAPGGIFEQIGIARPAL